MKQEVNENEILVLLDSVEERKTRQHQADIQFSHVHGITRIGEPILLGQVTNSFKSEIARLNEMQKGVEYYMT